MKALVMLMDVCVTLHLRNKLRIEFLKRMSEFKSWTHDINSFVEERSTRPPARFVPAEDIDGWSQLAPRFGRAGYIAIQTSSQGVSLPSPL